MVSNLVFEWNLKGIVHPSNLEFPSVIGLNGDGKSSVSFWEADIFTLNAELKACEPLSFKKLITSFQIYLGSGNSDYSAAAEWSYSTWTAPERVGFRSDLFQSEPGLITHDPLLHTCMFSGGTRTTHC